MLWVWAAGLFVFAAGACLWAAYRALSFDDVEIRRPLVVFLGLTAAWGVSNSFLVLPIPVFVMHASYIFGLVVGLATVVAWLWFCSAYVGTPYHYNRGVQILVFSTFVIIGVVKLTNPLHELYFRPRVASTPFTHFAPEPGLLYWLVAAIAYIGAAIGLYLLFDLYNASRFKTTNIAVLTLLIGLPVVPKLLAVVWPKTFLLVFYEPLGAAIFGIGAVSVARDTFLSVRAPARRQLADQLSELLVVVDNQDRIADYNESAEQMFGTLSEKIGQPLETAIPQLAAHEDTDEFFKLQRETETRYYKLRTPAVRLGDNTIGRAFVLSDITELEGQRRRLERQVEHLESVTNEMAHQLRNPITVLKGNLELLQDGRSSTDSQNETAAARSDDAMVEATNRIEAIAEDLISVITYGKPISEMESLVLKDVVETAVTEDESMEISVQFECEESIRFRGERVRCGELFRLLVRMHHQRGAALITITRAGGQLIISSDGEPFATDRADELFEYGVETDDDERVLLAHARTLVQVHGWSIYAAVARDTPTIVINGISFLTDEKRHD